MPRTTIHQWKCEPFEHSFLEHTMTHHFRVYFLHFFKIFNLLMCFWSMITISKFFDSFLKLFIVEDISPVASTNSLAFVLNLLPKKIWKLLSFYELSFCIIDYHLILRNYLFVVKDKNMWNWIENSNLYISAYLFFKQIMTFYPFLPFGLLTIAGNPWFTTYKP